VERVGDHDPDVEEQREPGPVPGNAEYDRLLHRRKGISGSQFAGIGIQFAVTIVLFAFAGVWLDKRLGTSPIFVLLMVLGGGGLAFWTMVRKLR
jgi:Putative F0F1-ATPase subunit Ca2+/Mg2+ transporter